MVDFIYFILFYFRLRVSVTLHITVTCHRRTQKIPITGVK